MTTADISRKLWDLCNVLRDDGITYHEYLTELTYLLFLKMAKETGTEKGLPKGCRWDDLVALEGDAILASYRDALERLGTRASGRVKAIFGNARTSIKQPKNLLTLVAAIDRIDWHDAQTAGLGDVYEGLLERNAGEKKAGAGQYFTPRPLIDCMVRRVQPKPGEIVQDPAAGTAGFLIAADRYVKEHSHDLEDLNEAGREFQRKKAFQGVEIVEDTHRLALMNLMLHGIEAKLHRADTLSTDGAALLPNADVILTNPPFGSKSGGGMPDRKLVFPTANKQLAFLQHIYGALKPGGRAAVVMPDNVLFENSTSAQIRADLMDKCELHTLLRLPTGIFYSQSVKTSVFFFTRGDEGKATQQTRAVWVYDLRANMPSFGKRTQLGDEHFADFEAAYGKNPYGRSPRKDTGPEGRFRKFTREEIKARGDNLDLAWLKNNRVQVEDDPREPEEIADLILEKLRAAIVEIEALKAELRGAA
jgi:type I restriction enzyme M protein